MCGPRINSIGSVGDGGESEKAEALVPVDGSSDCGEGDFDNRTEARKVVDYFFFGGFVGDSAYEDRVRGGRPKLLRNDRLLHGPSGLKLVRLLACRRRCGDDSRPPERLLLPGKK